MIKILLSSAGKCNFPLKCKLICISCLITRSGNDTSSYTSCGGTPSLANGETKPFYCDPPIVGRYVSVVVLGTGKVVSMCEVEVYSVRQVSSGVTGDHGFV